MKSSIYSAIGMGVALCLAVAPAPALAGGFTPEGQQHWLEVAKALTTAAGGEAEDSGKACPGFSVMGGSAEIRTEYFQVPKWAVNAHAQTCFAFNTLSKGGKGFMHMNSGDVCKFLKAAVGELDKAKAGTDPDDVVAAAGQLRAALSTLGSELKEGKACRIG